MKNADGLSRHNFSEYSNIIEILLQIVNISNFGFTDHAVMIILTIISPSHLNCDEGLCLHWPRRYDNTDNYFSLSFKFWWGAIHNWRPPKNLKILTPPPPLLHLIEICLKCEPPSNTSNRTSLIATTSSPLTERIFCYLRHSFKVIIRATSPDAHIFSKEFWQQNRATCQVLLIDCFSRDLIYGWPLNIFPFD